MITNHQNFLTYLTLLSSILLLVYEITFISFQNKVSELDKDLNNRDRNDVDRQQQKGENGKGKYERKEKIVQGNINSISNEQKSTPTPKYPKLAYSLVISNYFSNLEKLLRKIYTKSDIYCIHIDGKISTESEFYQKVVTLVEELSDQSEFRENNKNIHILPKELRENVTYASFYRFKADLNCVDYLMNEASANPMQPKFDYFINLCERDLPLHSITDLKNTLADNYPKCYIKYRNQSLWHKRWKYYWNITFSEEFYSGGKMKNTWIKRKEKSPITPFYSGDAYVVVSRAVMELRGG